MAKSKRNPRIAIIDLGHDALRKPNKIMPAKYVLGKLKVEGQAGWARYRGHGGL